MLFRSCYCMFWISRRNKRRTIKLYWNIYQISSVFMGIDFNFRIWSNRRRSCFSSYHDRTFFEKNSDLLGCKSIHDLLCTPTLISLSGISALHSSHANDYYLISCQRKKYVYQLPISFHQQCDFCHCTIPSTII